MISTQFAAAATPRRIRKASKNDKVAGRPRRRPCGRYDFTAGTVAVIIVALAQGVDCSITLASAPAFFDRMDNFTYSCGSNESSSADRPGSESFSSGQSAWAIGQMVGSLACIGLPGWLGFRATMLLYVSLSIVGNILYAIADPSIFGFGMEPLAIVGRAVNGVGAASISVALGYIPLHEPDSSRLDALIIHKIALMSGMFIGALCSLPLSLLTAQELQWGRLAMRSGVGAAFVAILVYIPCIIAVIFSLGDDKPPTKRRAAASCYCDGKVGFWLITVAVVGWISIGIVFFLPVFEYNSISECEELATFISYATIGCFGAALLGSAFHKFLGRCYHGEKSLTPLQMMFIATSITILGLGLAYTGSRIGQLGVLSTDVAAFPDGLFVLGIAFVLFAGGTFSSFLPPLFQQTLPRTSVSAMMPVYTIALDVGQILSPRINVEILKVTFCGCMFCHVHNRMTMTIDIAHGILCRMAST